MATISEQSEYRFLSPGAKCYLLLLVPRLLTDLERLGPARVIRTSGIPEQDVTRLYFEFQSICRSLPDDPESIPSDLWLYLKQSVRMMTALVSAADAEQLSHARENAVRKFLPQARGQVEREYQQQRQAGTVEMRLAAILHNQASPEQSRNICQEAIRLEREQRFWAGSEVDTSALSAVRAYIVADAQAYARARHTDNPEHFSPVDLVIRLLDLLGTVLPQPTTADLEGTSREEALERIILGLGNVLYGDELGL